jgi:hypothetical protein
MLCVSRPPVAAQDRARPERLREDSEEIMADYADLEIGLEGRGGGSYSIQLRFTHPESDSDVRLTHGGPFLVPLELNVLRERSADPAAYGQTLSSSLFAASEVRAAFSKARAVAASIDVPLRVRLLIGPTAPELHDVRWETLRDPEHPDAALLTDERLLFSRYLSSFDWRPVRLRPRADLRALAVIANPSNLTSYKPNGRVLTPVDVEGELARARESLGSVPLTALASSGAATLAKLVDQLRSGFDILYLVCHGAFIQGEPRLWLENDAGASAVVAGSELVTRVRELEQRPRLVVLASCQSAGTGTEPAAGDEGALAALGPRLAEAGVPAVLAMQGNISMETVARFMPVFFEELEQDGQIDRAMAVARGAVRDRFDAWMPVLLMRLKSGRIWYTAGFGDDNRGLKKWPALMRNIQGGRCTPIVGPGVTEALMGARDQIAQRWAEAYNYPMAPHQREELPLVAQFLAVDQDRPFLLDEMQRALRDEVLRRGAARRGDSAGGEGRAAGPGDRAGAADRDLPPDPEALRALISEVGAEQRASIPAEPHRVLAGLPFPIYITTNPDSLLADALRERGKTPEVELCRWNKYIEGIESVYDREPLYRPAPQRPLVYHLFGRLEEPDSLVLTVDDYFDFLIGFTSNQKLIPAVVLRALTDSALLLLGFQIDDLTFRVLYRIIMAQEGSSRRNQYAHVAAQIDPEEGRILEPQQARRYLESYFQGADISIYWGSIEAFMEELLKRQSGGRSA